MNRSCVQFGMVVCAGMLLAGCGGDSGEKATAPAEPTFTRDVAPIIFENCTYCHRPGQAAPFEFMNYADVSKRAKQIAEVVEDRYMPPWLPAPGYNQWQHERTLTQAQIDLIKRWVDNGAPEGDPGDLPPPPKFHEGWMLGKPDLIVKMPEPFELPADGADVYRNFVIPIPNTEPRYVRALEFRPGNPRVVHHAFLAVDNTGESHRVDANDPEPGFGGMHLPQTAAVPDGQFFSWQPGKVPIGGADERSWRLGTNSWLVIQLHMQTTGKPESVQSEVGIYFAEKPGTDFTFKLGLSSYNLDVPAGESNFVAEDAFVLPVDAEVLAVLPHAHYVARRMQAMATLPDGTSRWLLNIPQWDFNWQGEYWYEKPVALPAGTRVGMRFFYDNSTNNPVNPSNPPQPVSYGLQSTDEMAELWLVFRLKSAEDRFALNQAVLPKYSRDVINYSQRILLKEPSNANAWLRKAVALYSLDQREEAYRDLRRALQFDPEMDEAHYYLGLMAFDSGDLTLARDEFYKAVELNRDNFKAHGYLGLVYTRMNELAKAEASFLEALRANPEDTVARNNLERLKSFKPGESSPATPIE